MQYLVHTGRTREATAEVMAAGTPKEVARVRELYASGVLRQIWHRADRPGAVLLLEAGDEAGASAAMSSLPLVMAGAVFVESLVELKPYGGFVAG